MNPILTIVIVIGVFLLMREVTLWYFKINEIVSTLKTQIEKQDVIISLLRRGVNSDNDKEVFSPDSESN